MAREVPCGEPQTFGGPGNGEEIGTGFMDGVVFISTAGRRRGGVKVVVP